MKTAFSRFLSGAILTVMASLGLMAQSRPGTEPDEPPVRPTLRITEPAAGASFQQGSPVYIVSQFSTNPPVEARVSVYVDGEFVGLAEELARITIFPPPPPAYAFTWAARNPGRHRLHTVANYWNGNGFAPTIIVSPSVEIEVTRSPEPTNAIPVVTVRSLRDTIVEGAGPTDAFELRRTGPLGRALTVEFDLGGSATRGVDYAIPYNRTTAEFAPGSDTARVIVRPAIDPFEERRESVVIELLAPNIPAVIGAVPPYMPGEPSRAETYIVDRVQAPRAEIVWQSQPVNLPYHRGETVPLQVVATDPSGYLPRIEFFAYQGDGANRIKIGESQIVFITPPPDGTPITHILDWVTTNAFGGTNRIIARAVLTGADGGESVVESAPFYIRVEEVQPVRPVVLWQSPASEDRFRAGETVHLRVVATDPEGYLPRVEFFAYRPDRPGDADSVKIGESSISFLVAPTNGTPIVHELDWVTTNAFDGVNRLLARAIAADGTVVTARPLSIFVGGEPAIPTVGIHVEKGAVSEANPMEHFVFRIARTGPVDEPLTVYFMTQGSATRGYPSAIQRHVDYWLELNPCDLCAAVPIPVNGGEVVIPAGASEVRIGGRVVDDDLVEGDESAVIRLIPGVPPNADFAVPFYHLEQDAEVAEAVIHDNDTALELPVVTVHALDASGSETNVADTIIFEVRRSGPTNETLYVNYLPAGSAQYLVDYRRTTDPTNADPRLVLIAPPVVEIPAGETNGILELVVRPDDRREGEESVVINLTHPIPAPNVRLRPTYVIGEPGSARAVIHDTPVAEEPPPTVSIAATDDSATEPSRGAREDAGVFTLTRTGPTNRAVVVGYSVSGTARNGRDYEYLDGDATIPAGAASREIRVVPLRDDHDEGEETVVLTLRPAHGYAVGDDTNATVTIRDASASTNSRPTLVINTPADDARFQAPTNVVIEVTAVDPLGDIGRVEFYANSRLIGVSERLLDAAVAPGTPIRHEFVWTNVPAGAFRLVARALAGDLEVRSDAVDIVVLPVMEPPLSIPHPADAEPADFVLTADEVGVYAAAWRNGGSSTNRIAPAFVARAGFLLQSGGTYEYRPRFTRAPLFWVPVAGTNAASSTSVEKAGAVPSKEEQRVFTVLTGTILSGFVDTSAVPPFGDDPSVIWPGGVVDREPLSFAIAEIPADASVSNAFSVTLRVLPATGVLAHLVEFAVGSEVTVTNISDGGVFDSQAGVIRWGPFYDDANRRLAVTVTGASPRALGGVASFDGYDTGIRVTRSLPAGEDVEGPRITSIETRTDGAVQLLVVEGGSAAGAAHARHALEVSNDLRVWRRVGESDSDAGETVHVDPDASEDAFRYYRVVTE